MATEPEAETLELEPGETLEITAPEAEADPTPISEPASTDDPAIEALVSSAENAVEIEHVQEAVAEVEETTRTTEEELQWLRDETIPSLNREISELRNRLDQLAPLTPLAEAVTEAEEILAENPTTEPSTPTDTSDPTEQTPMEPSDASEQSEPEAEAVVVAVVEPPRRRWI